MPLDGENVMVPTDNDVAEYFYQRKLLTVNGMHTTLAFMTLCEDFDAKKELTAELMDGVRVQPLSTLCTDSSLLHHLKYCTDLPIVRCDLYQNTETRTLAGGGSQLAPQGPSSPIQSWDGVEIEWYEDEDGEDVEEAEEIPDLMLLTGDTASEQLREDMRLWSVANLVTLMSQFDMETMLKVGSSLTAHFHPRLPSVFAH